MNIIEFLATNLELADPPNATAAEVLAELESRIQADATFLVLAHKSGGVTDLVTVNDIDAPP